MAGRKKQTKADIPALKKMLKNDPVDYRPVIALTMRYCGCTFTEIGELFGVTRQMAETLVKKAENK